VLQAVEITQPVETPPLQTATIEAAVEELQEVEVTAPIPRPRPKALDEPAPQAKPTPEPPEAREAPAKKQPVAEPKPTPKAEEPPKKKRQASVGGAGGADEADSAAAAQSGGKGQSSAAAKAAVDKYPAQVQARLRRALRMPKNAKGAQGEVHVSFVVAQKGKASQIAVVRSSGSKALDDAAIATVKRAAPFPPIPEASGRSTWQFTMPLVFQR
jgi:protein TonB